MEVEFDARTKLLNLNRKREQIDNEMKECMNVLKMNNIGMTEPLIDDQGFPLPDVDVRSVRIARNRIICLKNDYQDIMKDIEQGLEKYYSTISTTDVACVPPYADTSKAGSEPEVFGAPFATIAEVRLDSPADLAGFRVNDKIIALGSITADNVKTYSDVSDMVYHRLDSPIPTVILRNREIIKMSLTPRRWTGDGILGCRIVLFDTAVER